MTFTIVSSLQSQVTGGVNTTDFSFADITNSVVSDLASTNWSLGQYNGNTLLINSPCVMSKTGKYIMIGGYSLSTSTPYYISVSSDYGQTWTRSNFFSPNTTNYTSVTGVATSGDGAYMYAMCYNDAYVRRSTNFGVSWDYSYNAGFFQGGDVACSYDGKYVIAGCNPAVGGGTSMSCNYGVSFTLLFNAGIYLIHTGCVAISNDGYTVLASTSTNLYKTTQAHIADVPNGSVTYSLILTSTNGSIGSLCMSSNNKIIMAGASSNGAIYISNDGGSTWTLRTIGSGSYPFCSMSYDGKQMLVVFGGDSSIYYSTNGNASNVSNITFTKITSLQNFSGVPSNASWAGSAVSGDGSRAMFISNTTIGSNTQKLAYLSDNAS